MSTRRQHNRLDKIEQQTDTDSGPLVSFIGPQLDSDPPKSFQSEEAALSYFEDRDEDPMFVSFAPIPDDKQK